jgi:peptide/nickel transport system permease protein
MTISSEQLVSGGRGEADGYDAGGPEEPDRPTQSRRTLVLRRFLRSKESVIGFVLLALLFFMAFVGPYFTHWSYLDNDFTALRVPPNADHWFGTNQIGQDMFALTMRGAQKTLIIGLLVAVLSVAISAIVGAFAGYFGGKTDKALSWLIDLFLVIPVFLVVSILSPRFRGSTWLILVVLIAAFGWMITARIVRGMTISLREREFVQAARYMGVSPVKIIFKHIIPNIGSLLIIDGTLQVSIAVVVATSLSYFGFGVQAPDVSIGTLLQSGTNSASEFPWLFGFPALMLVLTVLAASLLGDGLRDALDPNAGKSQ